MKRRQRNRRILIIAAVAVVVVIFGVSAYYLSLPTALDAFDNKPATSSQIAALNGAASPPFVNGGSALESGIKNLSGPLLTSNGKPVILYVGEDGCPYCAVMRWSLVLSLMRFGTFTNLQLMTSSYDATDFPTFTFHGSTYQSSYLVLAGYETLDRGTGTVDTLPGNYAQLFSQYSAGNAVPFTYFAGKFYAQGALLPSSIPGYSGYIGYLSALFGSKDWDQVISDINSARSGGNDPLGTLILSGANVITAKICQVTGGAPANVCTQGAISVLGPYSQTVGATGAWSNPNVNFVIPSRRY